MQNMYMKELNFLVRVCDFKTSSKLRLTTHKESVHEVTQFFVRYLTEQIKKNVSKCRILT